MFKHLKEMMNEAEPFLSGVKALKKASDEGAADAASRHKAAINDRKQAERDALAKQKQAERTAAQAVSAENKIKDKAAKEAEAGAKAAREQHQSTTADAIANLHKEIDEFITNFFDRFPYQLDAEQLNKYFAKEYPSREVALAGFKAYKGIVKRMQQLLDGMNKSLVAKGLISPTQLKKAQVDSANTLQTGNVNAKTIQFVKTESKFFKRLITVNDDFELDDVDFKDLLALKMNQTDKGLVSTAVAELNVTFSYFISSIEARMKIIADIGRTLPTADDAAKNAAHDSAAAKTAAETEADARAANGPVKPKNDVQQAAAKGAAPPAANDGSNQAAA